MRVKASRTGKEIIIDDEDAVHLLKVNRSYSVSSHGYAVVIDYLGFVDGDYKYKRQYLHRLIMNAPRNLQVDHINGNRLDNRKENLRLCMNKTNNRNKSQSKGAYKGVHFNKNLGKWVAQITKNRKCKHIGVFDDERDAAIAYNSYAKKLHGKYAFLNNVNQ
jgi:hypothetical protein